MPLTQQLRACSTLLLDAVNVEQALSGCWFYRKLASRVQDCTMSDRQRAAQKRGVDAEAAAAAALTRDGWTIRASRLRTKAGEVDLVAERDGLIALIEVKARRTLSDAAVALGSRQQARLLAAAEIILANHPAWGGAGVRFDLLLVDAMGRVRRIADAFRLET
jgi:putative endonuclease